MDTTLRENINWVGYVDWNIRDFHSYSTTRGATYNSYLIRDEKNALIDTVKAPYAETLIEKIAALCPLDKMDFLICNHAEQDHAGSLGKVVAACPNAKVVCNAKCRDTLSMYTDTSGWNFHIVKSGDTLSLGKRTLTFIDTPMVHWPESMATYVPEEKLLFSMDGFGQHYASSRRFDDETPIEIVMQEARTYYANIVMPYGKQVSKVVDALGSLDIEMIAPAHGVVWRSYVKTIIGAYKDWMVCRPRPKVLVIYDTMWGSTETMAQAIADGASIGGLEVKLISVRKWDMTFVVPEVLDSPAIAFGSSTLNQTLMPSAAALLTYMKGLRPQNKCGFAFGSYGWGKGGPEAVDEYLKDMKFEILRDPIRSKFRPTKEVLDECAAAGEVLGNKAMEMAAQFGK